MNVPWWIWLALGLIVVVAVQRYFGLRAAIMSAVAVAAGVIYSLGRRDARRDLEVREKDDAIKIRDKASEARAGAARRDAAPDKLRDTDGFRRD